MKLYFDKRLKDPTYYIQEGYRINGKATTRNIKKLGKHSDILKFHSDPLIYAKEEIAKFNEDLKNGKVTLELNLDLSKTVIANDSNKVKSTNLNIGYFFLQKIYQDLEINKFIDSISKKHKIEYPAYDINRFLTFSRILDPASKLSTFDNLDSYYEKTNVQYHQILRYLSLLSNHSDEYLEHLYKKSTKVFPRNTQICYYDCSNYYFEIEENDEDYIDEVSGEVLEGLRKYGKSKEHRPNPIVQMGLFMDANGIPLTMSLFPGNKNEQTSAILLEEKLLKINGGHKIVYCSDAGLGSTNIRKFNDAGGRAFIVTQSIKKLTSTLKEAVFNDCDYHLLSSNKKISLEEIKTFDKTNPDFLDLYNDYAYKVINADKLVDTGLTEEKKLNNGKTTSVKATGKMKQRIIITYSRKYAEYQKKIRNKQIDRAKKMLENNSYEKSITGPNDVRRFIVKAKDSKAISYCLDQVKIDEEAKYDGFYAIATNLDDNASDIIKINSKRYKIEDCFRVLKTNFEARPVYHYKEDRIVAHFLICYTSLLIYRLLENKINKIGKHYTTNEIIDTLKNINVSNIQGDLYNSNYTNSDLLGTLIELTGLKLDYRYYRDKDLKKIIKNISK